MKMKMIAYKDTKLNIFTRPSFIDGERSNEDIIESTRRMCADPKCPKTYFEYDLYCLGLYDDKLGTFEAHDPEFLVSLGDYKHLASTEEEKVDVVS